MRVGSIAGRFTLFVEDLAYDIANLSGGEFGELPEDVFERWQEFTQWARTVDLTGGFSYDIAQLGAPVPRPRQILAIGLNYKDHAAEAGLPLPEDLTVFTKFASSLSGPVSRVELSGESVDWESELVVVVGRVAKKVSAAEAWEYVAGLTAGQDISDRQIQSSGPMPQFSLAKSFSGYGPIGPWIVTPDEFSDPNDLAIECSVSGDQVQNGRTGEMVFGIADIVARLSEVVTLYPGDLIFTGTPSGVGMGITPPRFLRPGDVLETTIEGIGSLRQTFM